MPLKNRTGEMTQQRKGDRDRDEERHTTPGQVVVQVYICPALQTQSRKMERVQDPDLYSKTLTQKTKQKTHRRRHTEL